MNNNNHRQCIVCHEEHDIEKYCGDNKLVYLLCRQCGLIYVDNFANKNDMYGAYTGGIAKSLRRKITGPFRSLKSFTGFEHFSQRGNEIYQFTRSKMKNVPDKSSLLDIGCNKGFILSAAADDDCDVHGVELVTELITPFKNSYPQFKDNIFSGTFQDAVDKYEDQSFDMITAIDVVEHFEDPVHDLREIHRILKDDGVVVIQTPDTGCEEAYLSGCAWGALKPLEHLHLWNQENFTTFARAHGFSDVEYSQPFEYADGNFLAILRKG